MGSKRHALGQHFLVDPAVSRAIVAATLEEARRAGAREILEIGPGRGALTELLDADPSVTLTLVEKDRALAAAARERFPRARLVEGDFLDLQPSERRPVAVSNLPYSSSVAILQRLCVEPYAALVLMFQAEVAKRILAGPREDGRGSLSVWVQSYWSVEPLIHVPPRAFRPPPKVMSTVLLMRPLAHPRLAPLARHADLTRLLMGVFAHPRKMLRSALGGRFAEALRSSGVDPTLRAEALDWPKWEALWRAWGGGSPANSGFS